MILYKYKSLENFEQFCDLLTTNRLYCPTPNELNDPLEGLMGIDFHKNIEDLPFEEQWKQAHSFWAQHEARISRYRLCSFSKSPESMLMWSYYGGGHSGICLELNMEAYAEDIHEVTYLSDIEKIDKESITSLLTHKLDVWAHEEECRWLSNGESESKYLRANIQSVLIGTGIKSEYIRPVFELCAIMGLEKEIVSFSTTGQFQRFRLNKEARWDDRA